ncbi:MAG TPA: DUF432 domain-containing protein [Methanocorpusculum sp.]|nr:DUF432 domain-containing protein [Methanocorpusculum sp.]
MFQYDNYTLDDLIKKSVDFDGLSISFEDNNDTGIVNYKRQCGNNTKSFKISVSNSLLRNSLLFIHPVEPLYLPDPITEFLEIKFDDIMIKPTGSITVYLTFPIEIGLFIKQRSGSKGLAKPIDIFSFISPKYSLYGESNRGIITRWHKSQIYAEPPTVKNNEYGILEVEIENTTDTWRQISRLVINKSNMHIHYNDSVVSMKCKVNIINKTTAGVIGINEPLFSEMYNHLPVMIKPIYDYCNVPEALDNGKLTMDMGLN